MDISITVLRSASPLVDHSSTRKASNITFIIKPEPLPPVATPPNRVAIRMSWNPRKDSAMISCITEIAIQPAIRPVTATRRGE
jgi:hypothetical protein